MSEAHIFVIKNMITEECYYGVTTSKDIKRFNPIKFLYGLYMEENNKFTNLGKSIDEYTIVKFKYFFLKKFDNKDEAIEKCNALKERPEATLNKVKEPLDELFEKEIKALNKLFS